MRNKASGIVWGLIFIIIGVGFLGNALSIWNFNLFFDGWWTLFIIIPCLVSVFQQGANRGNIIGLVIGSLLLLSFQRHLGFDVSKMFVPLIFILLGVSIIFKGRLKSGCNLNASPGEFDYFAIFGGQNLSFANQNFEGANFTAIFGGFDIDLRLAHITQDVVIDATTIFGGADIYIPSNVKVKVSCTPIFGGVDAKAVQSGEIDAPTIHLNAICLFGGVSIK